jgi:arylsulfatase A-like enzyme
MIAAYHGWVTFIDNEIGRLLRTLEQAGERENTLFVFTSDHGAFLTRHKMHDKGPAMYEDIYNVPMIIDGLTDHVAERVEERFVSLLDIAPTVLDAADRSQPPEYDGQSLFDLYRDHTDSWRGRITAEFHGHFFAYEQRMIRDNRYKLVCNEHDIPELYDLQADPDELTNLVTDPAYGNVSTRLYSGLVDELRKRGDDFLNGPTLKMSRTEDIGLEKYEAGSDSD